MFLSDADIHSLLPELAIESENDDYPFIAGDQIQPCSIDLRLSRQFWEPIKPTRTLRRRRWTIDLSRSSLDDYAPRRHYRRIRLREGETKTLHPGELILGRCSEKFTIPSGYAGELSGRSSFARMGLMVECSGMYINPGYRGHMPLQILNLGPHPIKLVPYLPICQIRIAELTSTAERPYGTVELQSKYLDDDGGPSYWWRDKRVKELHRELRRRDIAATLEDTIMKRLIAHEPEVWMRFQQFFHDLPVEHVDNAKDILNRFSKSEDSKRTRRMILRTFLVSLFPIVLPFAIGSLLNPPYNILDFVIMGLLILLAPISLYAYTKLQVGDYLGSRELRSLDGDGPTDTGNN